MCGKAVYTDEASHCDTWTWRINFDRPVLPTLLQVTAGLQLR
jgi:hypothetical protein